MAPEGVFPYSVGTDAARGWPTGERTVLGGVGASGDRTSVAGGHRGASAGFAAEVHPDRIVIGSGAQSLMACSCSCSVVNLAYGVEDPAIRGLRIYRVERRGGAADRSRWEGPILEALGRARTSRYLHRPSHQFLPGIAVPVSRRSSLLEWVQ